MSKYGAACDNLLSAQLVTVDGRQVEASQTSNPDLFWAIRGGGGNFGVATALEYQLHPVTNVLAGTLMYPPGQIAELLQGFVKLVAAAPDELNILGQVLPSEKGAGFLVLFFHAGDPFQGQDLLRNWRALKPQQDTVRDTSYLETQANINPYTPLAHFQTDVVVPELNTTVIETITTAAGDAPPNTRVFIVPIYGAVTRVRVSDTAFALRQPGYELDIMGRWNTPAEKATAVQWVKALQCKLQPLARGVYVNQLGETSNELVRAGYGPNYARLAEIKKKYDPNNLLRLNQNITPA
jgi:FAD/FMN-containing dehydrogenase